MYVPPFVYPGKSAKKIIYFSGGNYEEVEP
jgi:hypothetical protein